MEILLSLARVGFMRIEQIQGKWFKGYWYCIDRLSKLKQNKYIDCTYIERRGSGIYFLTKYGLDFINDYYGEENKTYAKSNKITHHISCGDLYINFPYKILEFELEYYLDEFIPDIYICYENGKESNLLVEIDNTNRLSKFIPKIKKYEKYLYSNKWKERFDKFPKCLIVSDIQNLEDEIKKTKCEIPFRIVKFQELKEGKLECCL